MNIKNKKTRRKNTEIFAVIADPKSPAPNANLVEKESFFLGDRSEVGVELIKINQINQLGT